MNTEQLYQQRLARYVTAMRNEKPDCVPIRPFVAEFTAKYAGYTCQEVAHDYTKAFDAAVKTAKDYGWDAVGQQLLECYQPQLRTDRGVAPVHREPMAIGTG